MDLLEGRKAVWVGLDRVDRGAEASGVMANAAILWTLSLTLGRVWEGKKLS